MGMASSQARLLSLTARLHDVELKAQNVMAQKIALATQKDALYQEYCDALDATALKVAFWDDFEGTKYVDANYDSVCSYNENRVKQYALRDNQTGLMLVPERTKQMYDQFRDKYSFAWAMLGYENEFAWDSGSYDRGMGSEIGIGNGQVSGENTDYGTGDSVFMTQVEEIVFNSKVNGDNDLEAYYKAITDESIKDDPVKQAEALDVFRNYLYSKYSSDIYQWMNYDKQAEQASYEILRDQNWEDISNEYNYYINLWTAINDAGGCKSVDSVYTSGEEGNKWFQNMVEAGLVTIQVFDDTNFEKTWTDTSFATSTNNNYLQEVQDDKNLKKAEAEYEHELSVINQKDTKFDNELNKLETERTSITTEIESIGKVRDDNIDRTFKIFS